YNNAWKGKINGQTILIEKFLDRYFSYTPPAAAVVSAKENAEQVAGLYVASRRGEKSFLIVTEFIGQAKAFANYDGTLSIDPLKGSNGAFKRYEEISPLLYHQVDG